MNAGIVSPKLVGKSPINHIAKLQEEQTRMGQLGGEAVLSLGRHKQELREVTVFVERVVAEKNKQIADLQQQRDDMEVEKDEIEAKKDELQALRSLAAARRRTNGALCLVRERHPELHRQSLQRKRHPFARRPRRLVVLPPRELILILVICAIWYLSVAFQRQLRPRRARGRRHSVGGAECHRSLSGVTAASGRLREVQ